MKPHRIRVTHDLVTAYGMLDKMHVLVSPVLQGDSVLITPIET